MRPTRVYVAGPYTTPDPCINTRAAIDAANRILDAGLVPFVPHLSHFWHTVTPKPYEVWLALDFAWIEACDVLWRLPGESAGADREVVYAGEVGVPVVESFEALVAFAAARGAR